MNGDYMTSVIEVKEGEFNHRYVPEFRFYGEQYGMLSFSEAGEHDFLMSKSAVRAIVFIE